MINKTTTNTKHKTTKNLENNKILIFIQPDILNKKKMEKIFYFNFFFDADDILSQSTASLELDFSDFDFVNQLGSL